LLSLEHVFLMLKGKRYIHQHSIPLAKFREGTGEVIIVGSSGFGVGMPNRLGSGFRQFWNSNLEDGYRLERCVF